MTPEQKAEQRARIEKEHPDLAQFVQTVEAVFGEVLIFKPTTGWLQPQIEGKRDGKDERRIGRRA